MNLIKVDPSFEIKQKKISE